MTRVLTCVSTSSANFASPKSDTWKNSDTMASKDVTQNRITKMESFDQRILHTRASNLASRRIFDDLISLWIIRGWPDDHKEIENYKLNYRVEHYIIPEKDSDLQETRPFEPQNSKLKAQNSSTGKWMLRSLTTHEKNSVN